MSCLPGGGPSHDFILMTQNDNNDLEVASPPIFCCDAQHVICRVCKPRVKPPFLCLVVVFFNVHSFASLKVLNCPECRKPYGENLRRHRFAEKAANDLSELEQEREKILKIVGQ